jgi:Fur family ferric uptake transcriptional regulator
LSPTRQTRERTKALTACLGGVISPPNIPFPIREGKKRKQPLPKKGATKIESQIFADYLSRRGLRDTTQRNIILEEFLSREQHISAEDLYNIVKKRDRSIGQATVYRMLKLLCEAGLARGVDFGDGTRHYEHSFGHEHHDHLICTGCGKTLEVLDQALESIQKELAEKNGFCLTGHELYLYGTCPACQNSPKRPSLPLTPATQK